MDNTREKLIELILNTNLGMCIGRRMEAETIVDNLIANGVTLDNQVSSSKWIPVTERLPKNDYGKHWKERQYYLVKFNPSGLMCVAHYGYKEHDWWIDEHDCVLSATNFKEVTHWMPLPEPPKED